MEPRRRENATNPSAPLPPEPVGLFAFPYPDQSPQMRGRQQWGPRCGVSPAPFGVSGVCRQSPGAGPIPALLPGSCGAGTGCSQPDPALAREPLSSTLFNLTPWRTWDLEAVCYSEAFARNWEMLYFPPLISFKESPRLLL